MPNQSTLLAGVERAAVRLACELGYEFVDAELVKEPGGRFLRIYIDSDGGITLNELETFHRKILPMVENIDYDYMEVSSPGADRPLKKPRDFERAAGENVEIRLYDKRDGSKTYFGKLVGLNDGRVTILQNETEISFELSAVALVRLSPEIDFTKLDDC